MATPVRSLRPAARLIQTATRPVPRTCGARPQRYFSHSIPRKQLVGGPNERTDYHINETAEWFYQHKGSMLLKVVDQALPAGQQFKDIHINEGDMFLLPPNTPHNPVRFKDTVGIVLEQKRPEGSLDRLRWYCQNCGDKVHEAAFHCTDLGTQIKDAVNAFKADTAKRTCKNCGSICDTAPQPKA
ncbi:3-hydroxyanthranilate 3,4-dioxygenase [Stemphylium lycopersici]|uniref:3-hydroxyanthranilate 3,4-dioxygenase n=1 Tax=Stemphylium lycopersici TaxID=183478 RepID=A0A364NE74_STELY|nr:3-hydroxyanthranilate 3,4-dioxygenase [Stemphylium lycopersici]